MNCPRCGRENPETNLFCGRCGLEFAKVETSVPADAGEQLFCFKHKKQATNLRCGRCERPICHRCVVLGPAGPRCRDCARQNIPVSARAIAGEAKLTLRSVFRAGPWAIYIWLLVLMLSLGVLRSCWYEFGQRDSSPETDISSEQ